MQINKITVKSTSRTLDFSINSDFIGSYSKTIFDFLTVLKRVSHEEEFISSIINIKNQNHETPMFALAPTTRKLLNEHIRRLAIERNISASTINDHLCRSLAMKKGDLCEKVSEFFLGTSELIDQVEPWIKPKLDDIVAVKIGIDKIYDNYHKLITKKLSERENRNILLS